MFDIDNYEKEILAVGYENKIIETRDKWNKLNLIDMQSLLGTNHHLTLSHMDRSFIWLEETNQRINEFSIGYMMNPNFHKNKAFREQVKVRFKNTFGTSTNAHIGKRLLKENKRVLALVMLYENRKKHKEDVQSVELCNIYYYQQICLY